jgi:hypothetical protein
MRPSDPEEQFVGGKQFKRKSTKKWCKGVKGREHVPVIELNIARYSWALNKGLVCGERIFRNSTRLTCYHHEVCQNCGKELNYFVVCPTTGVAQTDNWW